MIPVVKPYFPEMENYIKRLNLICKATKKMRINSFMGLYATKDL